MENKHGGGVSIVVDEREKKMIYLFNSILYPTHSHICGSQGGSQHDYNIIKCTPFLLPPHQNFAHNLSFEKAPYVCHYKMLKEEFEVYPDLCIILCTC